MTWTNSSTVSRGKNRREPPGQNVHVALSKRQRAYSVFQPAADNLFPLFKVILVLSDPAERANSPFDTAVNLNAIFTRLNNTPQMRNGEDQSIIDAFLNEFKRYDRKEPEQSGTQCHMVSEESLRNAGLDLSTPAGLSFGISASRGGATTRQIRLQHHFTEAYQGGSQLHTLIWRYAQPVFRLILEELHGDNSFPSLPLDRGLLAIVTTRIVSTIGVFKSAETAASAVASVGDQSGNFTGKLGGKAKRLTKENYDNLYGVSGLHFIVFPIECTERHKWRIYRGINVCNSEMTDRDESFTQNTRNRDRFYQAQKWVIGNAEPLHGSDSTTVHRPHSSHMKRLSPCADIPNVFNGPARNQHDTDPRDSLLCVDVSGTMVPVWVDIDIRFFLNGFAQSQCRVASYYRKTASGDSETLIHAVHLLRSALRKYCFESAVRAIYDLSGCYRHGLGVISNTGIAKQLQYCASRLKRNYDSHAVWFRRLAVEAAYDPRLAIERKLISLMLYSRRTTSLALDLDNIHPGDSITRTSSDIDLKKKQDHHDLRSDAGTLENRAFIPYLKSSYSIMPFPDRAYQAPERAQERINYVQRGLAVGLINQYFAHPLGLVWHDITLEQDPLCWLKEKVFDNHPGEKVGADDPRDLRSDAGILGNRLIIPYGVSQAYVMRAAAEFISTKDIRNLPKGLPSLPTRIAYGLSRKYSSAECESGVEGNIEHDVIVPDYQELFQGDTVWIAVTYKHDTSSKKGDTFTNQHLCQALRRAWRNGVAAGHKHVRLWCDQVLRKRHNVTEASLNSAEWFSYGTYPYAALPVVTALGPHSRQDFTNLVKSSIWLSLEERLGASMAGIDLSPGLEQRYLLDLMAAPSGTAAVMISDLSEGVIWGHVPSATEIAYATCSVLLMYTGPITGYWEKANLELIKWALLVASTGTHFITSGQSGDQEKSKTGDVVIDTLKNIDYNAETNARNVPWNRRGLKRCYGGILDHMPAVRHIYQDAEEYYISLAVKHYRVSNLDRQALFEKGLRENNDAEVFVSLYHNSVVLYLVLPKSGHVAEIVNLRTIGRRRSSLASCAQDRTIPLDSRPEDAVIPVLIGAIIDFCNSTTDGKIAVLIREAKNRRPELECANGVKTWK